MARRLRVLSPRRLGESLSPYDRTVAEVGHDLAQLLADVAAAAEAGQEPPVWRDVPRIGDHAVGDQVAVCGHDAVRALRAVPSSRRLTTRDGRTKDVAELTDAALQRVWSVRLALP